MSIPDDAKLKRVNDRVAVEWWPPKNMRIAYLDGEMVGSFLFVRDANRPSVMLRRLAECVMAYADWWEQSDFTWSVRNPLHGHLFSMDSPDVCERCGRAALDIAAGESFKCAEAVA